MLTERLQATYEYYGTQAVQAAARFYAQSPDGQYDNLVTDILSALLQDVGVDDE